MKKKIEDVAVLKCSSYKQNELDKTVRNLFNLINFNPKKGSSVLLKPNVVMLGADKKKNLATITNPNLITAVCKLLKEKKCKIYIGESSFMNTDCFLKQSGIDKIAKRYGKAVYFEQEKLITIKDSKAKILKKFPVARILRQVDYIINMPKMKTHLLAEATLGVKNLYGLIPGGLKQKLHKKAKGKRFSHILVDIYQNFPCSLTLMDGILGMEGQGPTSGNPIKANVLLASKNTIALDIAAAKIMDFKPKKIPAIKFAVKRKLYPNYKFNLLGINKLPVTHFRQPRISKKKRVRDLFKEKPITCDEQKCIKCGICKSRCPVNAITLKPYPVIDRSKCIRCFCCMEVCPKHALSLKD